MKISAALVLLFGGAIVAGSAVDAGRLDECSGSQLHKRLPPSHYPWANQKRSVPLPSKRSYDTHHYYVVEVHPGRSEGVDPVDVAHALGAEFVERAGELQHHWLIRSEKPISDLETLSKRTTVRSDVPEHLDPILTKWYHIQQSARQPGFTTQYSLTRRQHSAALSIRGVERQNVRQRHKRNVIYNPHEMPHLYPEIREALPGPEALPYPVPIPAPVPVPVARPPMIPAAKTAEMIGTFGIKDPIFTNQWHLSNDRRLGNDLNLTEVWSQKILGDGVNVCLIDDGLDMHSPDLRDNFFAAGSYDFNSHTALPEPRETDDQHGTRCAGEIAAAKNDVCGVGVAHHAKVSGVRILSGPISDVDEAASLNYAYQDNHIYSCSWGPPDDGRSMDAPKGLIAKAILNGVQNGRDGKGSVFVFAGGNGGASDDQCNFDGYTNSIYSMTIAAVDREGKHPYYSEMCSAIIATSWSSGSGDHIHTTDVAWNGVNRCTSSHGGTSAAAPLAAGVVALALSVRPELTWRDVQHICVHSAVMINPEDPDWQRTQAGRHYNHKYGYGLIDAYQFVETAKRHTLVKPQAWYETPNVTLPASRTLITEAGSISSIKITEEDLKKANLDALEHVTVRVWITHSRRGDVNVELMSPHGTKSALARARRYDDATTGFPGWSFMTLKHWDESPVGEWKIRVFDNSHPDNVGNFYGWSVTLWGASIDASKAVPWNFPEDSVEYHETLAAAPDSTVIKVSPTYTSSAQLKKPTDHLPADHGSASGESHVDFSNSNGDKVQPPEADTGYISGLKKNSTWVIVAGGLVVIFAGTLAAFFIMRRRKLGRSGSGEGGSGGRGRGGEYEFLATDEEVAMGDIDAGRSGRKGGRTTEKSRRTKELYDAFAHDGSDLDEDYDEGGRSSKQEHRQFLVGASSARTNEPYRDHMEDDELDGDKRFALHAADDDDEDDDDNDRARVSPSTMHDRDTAASGSGSAGSLADGSWQDAAEVDDESTALTRS